MTLDLDALERQARDPGSLGRSSSMAIPADRVLQLVAIIRAADALAAAARQATQRSFGSEAYYKLFDARIRYVATRSPLTMTMRPEGEEQIAALDNDNDRP